VLTCSLALLASRSHRLSLSLCLSFSLVLSFSLNHCVLLAVSLTLNSLSLSLSLSFSFEWRAIELLRVDKRETQFKLRLLAVVTTVIITLAFHGDCRAHVHAAVAPAYRVTFKVHGTVLRGIPCLLLEISLVDRWLKAITSRRIERVNER